MTEDQFSELSKAMADIVAVGIKRMQEQAVEAAKLLQEQSEQMVRDFFHKEKPATDTTPSPP